LDRWLRPETLAIARIDKKIRGSKHRFVVVPEVGRAEIVRIAHEELMEFLRV